MPRIFSYNEFKDGIDEVKTYADKHSPVITCDDIAVRDSKFKVNVRIGKTIAHPNKADHRFEYVQLWDLETLLAEARFSAITFGRSPVMVEVDFYVVPLVSMRLKALAYCNKHGVWESEEVFVKVIDSK
ncbi:MAG: hypothetical protein LBG19_04110 [Prevotellaceae bacterium]|jgi:superoxide reductase|nr:hypothetical protein [Prevotellaceae bacterium]